jgi:hypothetical protein
MKLLRDASLSLNPGVTTNEVKEPQPPMAVLAVRIKEEKRSH